MNRLVKIAGFVLWASFAVSSHALDPSAQPLLSQGALQAAFAPWDNVEKIIIDEIGTAKKQILVQAYLLTSKTISGALIAAHRRGVDVQVMVDAEQLSKVASSTAHELARAGVRVWKETKYQNAHNKIIVIDAETPHSTVITGSYNFTWTAQHRNAENILISRDNPDLTARYVSNWNKHLLEADSLKK